MTTSSAPAPNRLPWIIAGMAGCLLLCMLIVIVGAGAYFVFSASPTPTRLALPMPTLPPAPTLIPTRAPLASPTRAPSPTPLDPSPTASPSPTLPTLRATVTTAPPRVPIGKIAFSKAEGDRPEDKYLWVMNADGSGARMIFARASDPSFSPDGTRIVFYHWTDGMYIANADGSGARKYIGDTKARSPAWSRDGRWIAFTSLDVVPANVLAGETPVRRFVVRGGMPDWSPDDTQIAFQTCRENRCGIYRANAQTGATTLVVDDDGSLPAWSPDGKRILYQKEVDGQRQLFVIAPDGTGKKQLTFGPAMHVAANWSLDGNFIFYRSPEGGAWAIWRMNADGSNRVKLIDNMPPVDWAFEKLAVSR